MIPYEGPNQTHRRPIYLECRPTPSSSSPRASSSAKPTLLRPSDRAIRWRRRLRDPREHVRPRQLRSPTRRRAVPLLLVRPKGITAYYLAREAMQWWTLDFGYELIDNDWKVEFPRPDPQMARLLQQVATAARTD